MVIFLLCTESVEKTHVIALIGRLIRSNDIDRIAYSVHSDKFTGLSLTLYKQENKIIGRKTPIPQHITTYSI